MCGREGQVSGPQSVLTPHVLTAPQQQLEMKVLGSPVENPGFLPALRKPLRSTLLFSVHLGTGVGCSTIPVQATVPAQR